MSIVKKSIIIGVFFSVFILLSLQSINAAELKSKDDGIDFSMTVEKKSLGWQITTTLVNNGNEWIYVEKNGYGDIGCIIYDEEDNEIWWTYQPDEGMHWQIGPGAVYESFTIWTEKDMDGKKVDKGAYKIVGVSGYFDGDEYVLLETDPYHVEVSKAKPRFFNNIINRFFDCLKLLNLISFS